MNRITIEKAAMAKSKTYYGMAKIIGDRKVYRHGFIAGAKWRINSVWHSGIEEPDERKDILVEFRFMTPDGEIEVCRGIVRSLDDLSSHCDVLNWAYLDDLMYDKEAKQ